MKKRIITSALLLVTIFSLCACSGTQQQNAERLREKWGITTTAENNKIIIDLDLMYINDDAFALLAALRADDLGYVDLLGVTATSCNVFAAASAYDTLSVLEHIGRMDIPVYIGEQKPTNGWVDLKKVQEESGATNWYGCYGSLDKYTDDWRNVKEKGLSTSPFEVKNAEPMEQSATDFIIEQIHKYPGKVTIITLSSLTTVAAAIKKDATIVEDAAGIVTVGGDFSVRADVLDDYEVNLWFDPEASNMCLNADWKNKTLITSDVAATCLKGKDVYELYKNKNFTGITKMIVENLSPIYENGKSENLLYCWDPITIAYYLYPSICSEVQERYVCVDEREGMTYGLTRDWKVGTEPKGVSKWKTPMRCDREKFWDFISDLYSAEKSE